MAGRKIRPAAAHAAGKVRLIELGKDVLIAALACSAVFLSTKASLFSGLPLLAEPAATAAPTVRQPQEAVSPYLVAVRNGRGLYGASYDDVLVGRVFNQVSAFFAEAFSTAGAPVSISEKEWRELLESPGVYCAFQGQPPLSALSAWLGGGDFSNGGSAQTLLLAWDGTDVRLSWQDGTHCWSAVTQVSWQNSLEEVLDEFNPNGAAFAYTLAESDGTYDTLDPYVLVSMTVPQPEIYHSSSPDLTGDRDTLERLMNALGFQSGGGAAYETSEGLTVSEGTDRLRAGRGGAVLYHAGGDESRYPVACAGETPTAVEAAGAAWDLLNRAAADWKGESSFVLTGVEKTPEGWTVEFHYRLSGIPVLTGEMGRAAQFVIEGRQITDFSLLLRTYTASGTFSSIPREYLAAAALRSMPDAGGKLTLCYSDTGSETVSAGWLAAD
ncbi:MAG: hypothetical protein PUC36_07145 [Clostridiales bacterium]|nr:hypothetical protein [Clostridiales bacterium]